MKLSKFIYGFVVICVFTNCIYSQTNTPAKHKAGLSEFIFGFGAGICTHGKMIGFSNSLIFEHDWGVGISMKTNILKSERLPHDFYSGNSWNITPPMDYVHFLSFTLIKKFPVAPNRIKIGIEGGPSLVRYNYAYFKLNPNYPDPNNLENKYNKYRSIKTTVGFLLRVKTEFVTPFGGFEMGLFSENTEYKSVWGIDFYFNLAIRQ
jgi:hypothetical protein